MNTVRLCSLTITTAPSEPHIVDSLSSASNILSVYVTPSETAWTSSHDEIQPARLLVSSADRKISVLSTSSEHELQDTINLGESHNSPVLSVISVTQKAFMTSSMSGHTDLYGDGNRCLTSGRHHAKYAVQVITTPSICMSQSGTSFCIAASAGWDQKIIIQTFVPPSDDSNQDDAAESNGLANAVTISVPTNPESILFVRHPDHNGLYLVVGRRDSTYLYYYKLMEEPSRQEHHVGLQISVQEAGRQNLAPHANAWISFSPSSLAACPTDPAVIAIATSHLPHMRLIIVRLLFPGSHAEAAGIDGHETQTSQAHAALAVQDREDVAILVHVSTMAAQTPYSTPQVVWRPDGSGVWVNGDDGVVRGVEARTGKVVATLKGHEVGSKVRSLWAGWVRVGEGSGEDARAKEEEWLVSGGFDKNVIVWKAGSK